MPDSEEVLMNAGVAATNRREYVWSWPNEGEGFRGGPLAFILSSESPATVRITGVRVDELGNRLDEDANKLSVMEASRWETVEFEVHPLVARALGERLLEYANEETTESGEGRDGIILCPSCGGRKGRTSTAHPNRLETCGTCNGHGSVARNSLQPASFRWTVTPPCTECDGSGNVWMGASWRACAECEGRGWTVDRSRVAKEWKPGADDPPSTHPHLRRPTKPEGWEPEADL